MDFWSFLNNSWFVGIVGGILSGLVTTWIGRKVFSGKDKKEYLQKVDATNKEIVYSLRSAISDNVNHDRRVILSLMSATARKNGVLLKDAYSIKEIAEDLIKEVMDSSFIPSTFKKEFCENLTSLYLNSEPTTNITTVNFADNKEQVEYSKKRNDAAIATATGLLGVMVALLTFTLTFLEKKHGLFDTLSIIASSDSMNFFSRVFTLTIPVFAALASMVVVVFVQFVIRKERKLSSNSGSVINLKKSTSEKENKEGSESQKSN